MTEARNEVRKEKGLCERSKEACMSLCKRCGMKGF